MKRMWVVMCLSLASIAAQAQDGLFAWETYEKKLKASAAVSAHGPDLFGDQVSLSNGAVSFTVTDVSIPGNSALPVAFGRTFTVGNRKGTLNDGSLADWHLDVPHISGVFAPDWVGSVPGNPGKRCSVTTAAHAAPPAPQYGNFASEDFWNGHTLHIPGREGGELLLIRAATPRPSTGGPYYWHVAGHSAVSCLPTTKNQSGREAFLVTTADGTRYWFDWAAQYHEPSIMFTIDGESIDGRPLRGTHPKRRNVLYATRVEDRFGNHVLYNYSNAANQPAKLDSIVASDGRRINVTHASGRVTRVEAVADDAVNQVWLYEYGNADQNQKSLVRVILPGDTPQTPNRWTLELAQLSRAGIFYWSVPGEPSRDCVFNWGWWTTGLAPVPGRMTHPSGAVGDFEFEIMTHGRSWVPRSCSLGMPPSGPGQMDDTSDDVNRWAISYESLTLTKKTLSGPGTPSATWTYEYQPNTGPAPLLPGQVPGRTVCPPMVDCSIPQCTDDSCAKSAVTTVRLPDGGWERYWHGNTYLYNEGKLLKVERGGYDANGNEKALNRTINTYDLSGQDAAYPARYGTSARDPGNAFAVEYHRPLQKAVVQQQNTSFTRVIDEFDSFAQPLAVTRSSTLPGSPLRKEAFVYENNLARWVIGQVQISCVLPVAASPSGCEAEGTIMSQTNYDSLARPTWFKSFGKLMQTLTYNADGTVATVKDGNNKITTLSAWKRGIPQSIKYPATTESPGGATQSAVVNDHGWITRVTDENSFATNYTHDAMGRLASIAYPTGDSTAWNTTTQAFQRVATAEYGIPAGHWRQTVATGNGRKLTYFDAMWRPLLTREYDATNEAGTQRFQRFAYDPLGRTTFASYPSAVHNPTTGSWTEYDALGRPTSVSQDSELGLLTTLTEYLTGFQTRVTNPKLQQTTTRYLAWDQPVTDFPTLVTHPEGAYTHITRDMFGKPTVLRRSNSSSPSGGTVALNRSYTYNASQELCRSVEPETGATLMGYDGAGNLTWSASGLPAATACHDTGNHATINPRKASRSYDARNRLTALSFADGIGNQIWTWTPDGLPASISTYNTSAGTLVTNAYTYNKRRLQTGESLVHPGVAARAFGYGYNANGHLTSLVYPSGLTVDYLPNALGQPTKAGTYATGVSYFPNGAVKQFTYGNGVVHTLTQNGRGLPARSTDCTLSGTCASANRRLDLQYAYDRNGNVTDITDHAPGGKQTRGMSYDDLDRLIQTTSPSAVFGTASYAYDVLDNLTTVHVSGGTQSRNHTYVYDATTRRLSQVKNTVGGAVVANLTYDVQGNLAGKGAQAYEFDLGNRLRSVPGQETGYRYDGHGRRVYAQTVGSGRIESQYVGSGQLLYQVNHKQGKRFEYVYLGNRMVAVRERPMSGSPETLKYQHTDALGSPLAVTNAAKALVESSEYEPYGRVVNKPLFDGPGYTGHVQDAATGLVYMQQRYYDPEIGRFLSADPVTAYSNPVGMFNRYKYAANNPYKYIDPDGRCEKTTGSRICGGGASNNVSVIQVNPSSGESRSSGANRAAPAASTQSSQAASSSQPDSVVGGDDAITDLGAVVVVAYRGEYHDQLVQQLASGMRSQGANVLTEVKMCLQEVCARIDILGRSPLGDLFALEVKTGLRPDFTPQQVAVYPHLRGGNVLIAPDQKVLQLGLTPGLTLPPIEGALLYQRDASSAPFVVPFP